MKMLHGNARLISIPKICDPRGNLSFIENFTHLPFKIGSVRWIYDIPAGAGSAAEISPRRCLVVAMSGAIDVRLTTPDGMPMEIRLSEPHCGLLLEGGVERQLLGCSSNAVITIIEEDENADTPDQLTPTGEDAHLRSSVENCRIIQLPREKWENGSGNVAMLTNGVSAPFDIKRAFYIYDVPGDSVRGGHSHFEELCLLVALGGCFDVTVSDGAAQRRFCLNRPYKALYVPSGIWRELDNFSSGSVCLALSSITYRESDYVRSAEQFGKLTRHKIKLL